MVTKLPHLGNNYQKIIGKFELSVVHLLGVETISESLGPLVSTVQGWRIEMFQNFEISDLF